MELIQSFIYSGPGYKPLLITEGWQVAILNHAKDHELGSLTKIDRHLLTDEAFCLISGKAWLIAAEKRENVLKFTAQLLEPATVANIPVKTWHAIVMESDARVLIVERDNTHVSDFEFHELTSDERLAMIHALRTAGFDC